MNPTTKPQAIRPGKFLAEMVQMDEGLRSTLPAGAIITVEEIDLTQAQIDAKLQGYIAKFQAVDAAEQAYQDALNARLNATVEARTYYKQLKGAIRTYFGGQSAKLATFGIATDKPLEITAAKQMVAVAKRTQTRKLRGTKGRKQLAAITVVGKPAVGVASDGTLSVGPTPVNLPAAAGSSPGSGNPGSGTPSAS